MGMFDQSERNEKLVIVHSENTAVFANYLQMLISSNDDEGDIVVGVKDGSIKTTIWSDKEYLAQKPSLSSNEHILFIGRGKIIPEECYGMETKFSQYGMAYGWLGKRAFLRVSDTPKKTDEIRAFFEYAKQHDPSLNEKEIIDLVTDFYSDKNQLKRKGIGGVLKDVGKIMIPGGFLWAASSVEKDIIKSIQYRCMTIVFYREGLSKFMNM